jgi:hypothetical protein
MLKEKEYFILISWIETYKSDSFMGSPKLNYDVTKLPELLDEVRFKKAVNGFLNYMNNQMNGWLTNTIDKNFGEWLAGKKTIEIEGYYESNLPNDINTMLIQQVKNIILTISP